MFYQGRKISHFWICVLACSVGILLFLFYEFGVIGETNPVGREIESRENEMDNVIEKPKQSLMDFMVDELEESLQQISSNTKEKKIQMSKVNQCSIKDEEWELHRCTSGKKTGCIQENMSGDLRQRLEDLVHNEHLKIAPQYREVLHELGQQIESHYRLVVVSALSSDYYLESQAMLKDLHEIFFRLIPKIKIVVYDLGLTDQEREEYQKFCKCTLIKFPFEKLPPFCSSLKCFCWKPFVIRAHLANGDMVMWMDASVRYNYENPQRFLDLLRRTQMFGLQLHRGMINDAKMPMHALPAMFHHFGFTPCAFKDYPNSASNWAMYRNTPLIQYAVLDPWAACGLNETCACPGPYDVCVPGKNVPNCQRPQTSMAIIAARLWMEHYTTVASYPNDMQVRKGHAVEYFKKIEKEGYSIGEFNALLLH